LLVTACYFGVYGEILCSRPARTFGSRAPPPAAGCSHLAGRSALLVPIAAGISKAHGWSAVFAIAMTFNVTAAVLAVFVLKPMRLRHFAKTFDVAPTSAPASS
jgi:OFA family oxalate/formate antiporter-like MFS transporter